MGSIHLIERNEIIEEHYRKHYKHLVKMMTYRAPNQSRELAEEVVQEAYTLAMKYFKTFNPERGKFTTWFNKIMNNALNLCHQTEGGNFPSIDNEELELEPFMIDEEEIPRELVVAIHKAIDDMPDNISEVLRMFFILGMNAREISECTEFTHTNIRQMIMRFRITQEGQNIYSNV